MNRSINKLTTKLTSSQAIRIRPGNIDIVLSTFKNSLSSNSELKDAGTRRHEERDDSSPLETSYYDKKRKKREAKRRWQHAGRHQERC